MAARALSRGPPGAHFSNLRFHSVADASLVYQTGRPAGFPTTADGDIAHHLQERPFSSPAEAARPSQARPAHRLWLADRDGDARDALEQLVEYRRARDRQM